MGKIDITLREVIQEIPNKFIELLTGKNARKLLDTSLPEVKERRADLLVELEDDSILHLELQTSNDKNMPYRMLEYYMLISSKYPSREINQMVLYIGESQLKMDSKISKANLNYKYILKDIREISCKELMKSSNVMDRIIAVLCEIEDEEKYFIELVNRLDEMEAKERRDYLKKLMNLLICRPRLKEVFSNLKEEKRMPITITEEMLKNDPFYQEGLEKGLERGLERGLNKAKREDIFNLHKKLKLEAKEISEILQVPVELVEKVIKQG